MKNVNWNEVKDANARPEAGGYAARIVAVEDNEQKEYLRIDWDFADGQFKGANKATFEQYGFYPTPIFRSYKEKALPFFKGFKTAVEKSNPNYTFKNDPQSLVGKFVGVVLGEEEYEANDGSVKTRLYVAEVRSGESIRNGDFKIPELKKLAGTAQTSNAPAPAPFYDASADDGDLPF